MLRLYVNCKLRYLQHCVDKERLQPLYLVITSDFKRPHLSYMSDILVRPQLLQITLTTGMYWYVLLVCFQWDEHFS